VRQPSHHGVARRALAPAAAAPPVRLDETPGQRPAPGGAATDHRPNGLGVTAFATNTTRGQLPDLELTTQLGGVTSDAGTVAASVGMAIARPGTSVADAVREADAAVYAAKRVRRAREK